MTIDDSESACRRKSLPNADFRDLRFESYLPSESRCCSVARNHGIDSSPLARTTVLGSDNLSEVVLTCRAPLRQDSSTSTKPLHVGSIPPLPAAEKVPASIKE